VPESSLAAVSPLVSLSCQISASLWQAIENRHRATGESVDHIVRTALADYLQVSQSTLFQISPTGALVEGIYRGEVTVATLREHGDLGLGTFDGLDGEMVMVDGRFFQVRSDGTVTEVDEQVRSPYAVITKFDPEPPVTLGNCATVAEMYSRLDCLHTSDNLFYEIRIDETSDLVQTRAVARTARDYASQ